LKNKKNLLSDKYSFKNFVVGPHNHLAYSAAQAVSKGCYKRYNPLFIYGKTGLGKTHLLHCIGNEYKKNNNEGKVIYKSSVSFVDEFILAIRQNKIQNFTDKYRKIDMLLIDDVQFFSQKEQTQEAFFHIFNQMYDEKKQIVLSCDMMPQQLSGFQERLISRFSWGLSADITNPTLETRIAILQHKAEELKIELSHEVANFIATTFITNIREMEGALTKLAAMTLLTFSPISLALAKKELTMTSISPALSITKPDDIVGAILKNFSVSGDDLRSRSRDSNLVAARQLTIYLLKKHTSCSLRTIGYFVGGRTHSTVLHAIAKVEKQLVVDTLLQNKLKGIENNLN
jgi:chromosomal replication initiator protein